MTDTNARTPSGISDTTGQADVPDVGFSVEELQYLLSINPGSAADRSAEILNVAPVPSIDETILVGGAALLARGQLEFVEGGEFTPVDAALVVAYILTNATKWTVVTGAAEESGDLGIFVESPQGGLLAQPRTLGTWWFIILDPAAPPTEIFLGTVMGMATIAPTTAVVAQTVTDDADRTFSLQRNDGAWAYAYGTSESPTPDRIVEEAAEEDLLVEVASFYAYFPEMS